MSLRANIDHLAAAQGIVAVSVVNSDQPRSMRGDDRWGPILDASAGLLATTGEQSIRLVVGKHTIVVQAEGEETVAVVLPTGHAIAKSLRRMIRRMSRKVRPPLSRPEPQIGAHVAPTTPAAPASPLSPSASQSSTSMEVAAASSEAQPTWG
ncbi:MAG: hypothetical protein JKY37_02495 [Nannocystaceae bacterium]|nr:hypothetical protein [Nannocystaceae bacterium]